MAVDDDADGVAGAEVVGLGEGFAGEDLAGAAGFGEAAGAEVEVVEAGGVGARERDEACDGGLGKLETSRVTSVRTWVWTRATPGTAAMWAESESRAR